MKSLIEFDWLIIFVRDWFRSIAEIYQTQSIDWLQVSLTIWLDVIDYAGIHPYMYANHPSFSWNLPDARYGSYRPNLSVYHTDHQICQISKKALKVCYWHTYFGWFFPFCGEIFIDVWHIFVVKSAIVDFKCTFLGSRR